MLHQRPILTFWLIALVCLGLLGLHAWQYFPFMSDDAFISLRYAQRLLEDKGLTWNDGQYVEGYSNFLWVLLVAGLGATGLDLVIASRFLGVLCAAGTIIAVMWPCRPSRTGTIVPSTVVGLCLAATGSVAVWVVGGLEQPLVALLLAWAMVLAYPLVTTETLSLSTLLKPSLFLALLCLTRPDGPLFTASVIGVMLCTYKDKRIAVHNALTVAALPTLLFCVHLVFRLSYYGDWVPNSSYIRFPLDEEVLAWGARYVWTGVKMYLTILLPAFFAALYLLRIPAQRPIALLLGTPLVLWLLYVGIMGGDIFPAFRHFVPALILAILILAQGLQEICRHYRHLAPRIGALAFILLLVFIYFQSKHPEMQRAKKERWEWNHKVIGLLLKDAFGDKNARLAINAAGALPYYSQLPTIDMLGINDRFIAQAPEPDVGDSWLAHDHGSGSYVLSLRPDLVYMSPPWGTQPARYSSELQMLNRPEFHRRYRKIYFQTEREPITKASIWVRRSEGAVGIQYFRDRLEIPGYLLATQPENRARLYKQESLAATLSKKHPLYLENLSLSTGLWRISADADQGNIRVFLTSDSGPLPEVSKNTFQVSQSGSYQLHLETTQPGEGLVFKIVLQQINPTNH